MTFINPELLAKEILKRIGARESVFFIDFDGTLAPIHNNPSEVQLTERNKHLLLSASQSTKIKIIVVSGRDIKFLQQALTGIPISIAGEHGAVFYNSLTMATEHFSGSPDQLSSRENMMEELCEKLSLLEIKFPGTFLERKNTSIAFHYRNIEDNTNIPRLKESLSEFQPNNYFKVIRGKDVFEFSFSGTSKGSFIDWWLKNNRNIADYIPVCIGDDTTDEFMFEICNNLGGLSIKVGEGPTQANYRLQGTEDVSCLLEQFLALPPPTLGLS